MRDNGSSHEKIAILTLKRRSHVRISIYRTWAIELASQLGASSLLAQLVKALHRYRRGMGSKPGKPEFFSGFLFATAKVAFLSAMILFAFISLCFFAKRFFVEHGQR